MLAQQDSNFVQRSGNLLVETKGAKRFFTPKWKTRYCKLTTDAQGRPIIEAYKLRGGGNSKIISFQINLSAGLDLQIFKQSSGKYCLKLAGEVFASFVEDEINNWYAAIEVAMNLCSSSTGDLSPVVVHIYDDESEVSSVASYSDSITNMNTNPNRMPLPEDTGQGTFPRHSSSPETDEAGGVFDSETASTIVDKSTIAIPLSPLGQRRSTKDILSSEGKLDSISNESTIPLSSQDTKDSFFSLGLAAVTFDPFAVQLITSSIGVDPFATGGGEVSERG